MIETVDYHTAGEPFRIVTGGGPDVPGTTVVERREAAHGDPVDRVRRLLCHEPRGHADMYGCFLVPPDDAEADLGVLFWHKDGYSTACGHGTIALGTWAVESGLIAAAGDGVTEVRIDVPSGRVLAKVRCVDGEIADVTFGNVASWVSALDVRVATSRGPVRVDISWGGAFYASIRAADLDLTVEPVHLATFIALSREVKATLAQVAAVRHPADPRLSGLYGCIWWDAPPLRTTAGARLAQRNVTVFADGEVDRSPCGSGTSARLSVLHARGELDVGDSLQHAGIIGSIFTGRVVEAMSEHDRPAVLTEVTGQAFRTGEHRFFLDARDPLGTGFSLR